MITTNPSRLSTGNELVSIPVVSTECCCIETISFLHRGLRATVELSGAPEQPFLQPIVSIDGAPVDWATAVWGQDENWVPTFELDSAQYIIRGRVFAPLQCRGFVYLLEIEAKGASLQSVRAGWQANWLQTCHATYKAKPMIGTRRVAINQWLGIPFIEFQSVAPHFAIAFHPSEVMEVELLSSPAGHCCTSVEDGISAGTGTPAGCSITKELCVEPGEKVSLALYVGLGLEEISAASSAADIARRGHKDLLQSTLMWLSDHSLTVDDERLERLMNLNMFYNYFFSQGVTLDTEEQVVVTSRSSRYPLTAAYADRDALLWSFPAVLSIDTQQARRMLEYAFRVQIKNVGIHSRFIDGIVLEPGFELDELCAPALALWQYLQAADDMSIVFDRQVQAGLNHILEIAALKKHPFVSLFQTSLLPSDEEALYPYVTYSNVIVWRMLIDLAGIYERIGDLDRKDDMLEQAKRVKRAIMEHAIVDGPFGEMFAWSIDLEGNYRLMDYPQGSLQLLPHFGFCSRALEQYKNTFQWIHSEENPAFAASHTGARRLSMFSVANDLLTDHAEDALAFLQRAPLDDGLICEVADAATGMPVSGEGYAAVAGFVAYAMAEALGAETRSIQRRDGSASPQFRLRSKHE